MAAAAPAPPPPARWRLAAAAAPPLLQNLSAVLPPAWLSASRCPRCMGRRKRPARGRQQEGCVEGWRRAKATGPPLRNTSKQTSMRTSHHPSPQSSCPLLSCWRAAAAPPAAAAVPLQQAASSLGGGEAAAARRGRRRQQLHEPALLPPHTRPTDSAALLTHRPTAHRGLRPLQGRFDRLLPAFC
jgi:hypothetical protein